MLYDKIVLKLLGWLLDVKIAFAAPLNTSPAVPLNTSPSVGGSLPNPFGEGSTITSMLNNVLGKIILLAAPIVTIMILYGAFLMLTSAGDPKKFEDGKKTIVYAVIGFFVVLLASSVPFIINDLLGVTPEIVTE